MKIQFWAIGKNHDSYIKEGVEEFTQRISRYFTVEWKIIPVPKNASSLTENELKKKEAETILQLIKEDDYLVALDERGKELSSEGLAAFIEKNAQDSTRKLTFLIGGAFGLHATVMEKARLKWSLSQLTFPHQLVRLILSEQVYRACTILHHEKYHHK